MTISNIDGLLALLLTLLSVATISRRRLLLPGIVYRLAALAAFCGWFAHVAGSGSGFIEGGALAGVVRGWSEGVAPPLLSVEAAYLAWVGFGLTSPWFLLELILAAALSPIVVMLLARLPLF